MKIKKTKINRGYTDLETLQDEIFRLQAEDYRDVSDIELEVELSKDEYTKFSKDLAAFVDVFQKLPEQVIDNPPTVKEFNFTGTKVKIRVNGDR